MLTSLHKDVCEQQIRGHFERLCAEHQLCGPSQVSLIKPLAVAYVVFANSTIAEFVFQVIFNL